VIFDENPDGRRGGVRKRILAVSPKVAGWMDDKDTAERQFDKLGITTWRLISWQKH